MILYFLPILPPELRPILKLKENIIATSDINYIYIKIININNRIERLKNLKVEENFIKKEKINLQISIDNLISNSNKIQNTVFRIFKIILLNKKFVK